jgi:hypothetical protein
MRSASSRSFDSVSIALLIASTLVLTPWSLNSSGVTGSSPYKSLKGVNFVALQTEVLWLHIALGSSSAHLPFGWSSSIFLIAVNITAFAFSTALFDCGWHTDVKAASTPMW